MDFKEFNSATRQLVEQLADRLPEEELRLYRSYAYVGEWDVLLNALAAILVKRQIPVTSAERDALESVLNFFTLPRRRNHYINNREEVVRSLNIIGQ